MLFKSLRERGLKTPRLIIYDAHAGLVQAIATSFPGATWQRCKVHFMRNVLAYVPKRDKEAFADKLKLIWLAGNELEARRLARSLVDEYRSSFPDAIRCLEEGLEDSLAYFAFPALDTRKVSSTNLIERLNREIRRRTKQIGIFPTTDSFTRLISISLLEYTEDWLTGKSYLSKKSLETLK